MLCLVFDGARGGVFQRKGTGEGLLPGEQLLARVEAEALALRRIEWRSGHGAAGEQRRQQSDDHPAGTFRFLLN